jgi:hypothetical protein
MNRRIQITLTEEEWQQIEQIGALLHLRQDWLSTWRSKLLHRAFAAFIEAASRQEITFPLRIEFAPQEGDFRLEAEFITATSPAPPASNVVSLWKFFGRRGDRDPDRAS